MDTETPSQFRDGSPQTLLDELVGLIDQALMSGPAMLVVSGAPGWSVAGIYQRGRGEAYQRAGTARRDQVGTRDDRRRTAPTTLASTLANAAGGPTS